MPKKTKITQKTWPAEPYNSRCKTRRAPSLNVVNAMRTFYTNWTGFSPDDWTHPKTLMEEKGISPEAILHKTPEDVQAFMGQHHQQLIKDHGGKYDINTTTVISVQKVGGDYGELPIVQHDRGYTVKALRDMTGLQNNTLHTYAKKAGVTTPGRGQRSHKYTSPEAIAILNRIVEDSTQNEVVSKAKAALAGLQPIE